MSRQPSPGPSQSQHIAHVFQPVATPSTRQKSRAYTSGVAAGAEDVKYQAKYKELKRKVKEIEHDNDKLHYKTLQSKKRIQRIKLERALLYERLLGLPPSPEPQHAPPIPARAAMHHGQPLPPPQPPHATHHHRDSRKHGSMRMDVDDAPALDYARTRGNAQPVLGPPGRPIMQHEAPVGHGMPPSQHGAPAGRSARHVPEPSRQLPSLSTQFLPGQHAEASRAHGHLDMHESPPMEMRSGPSHSRSESHSRSSRSRAHQPTASYHPNDAPLPPPQYHPDALPPLHHVQHGSPNRPETMRASRHLDISESHEDHPMIHIPPQASMSRGHSSQPISPVDKRSTGRIHHHQRVGPGANINRADEQRMRDYEREMERALEPVHDAEAGRRHAHHHSRAPLDRSPDHQEHHAIPRPRDDYHDTPPAPPPPPNYMLSRGGTPGSASASGNGPADGPPRPDSGSRYFDPDRDGSRSRKSRTKPAAGNLDFVLEDGRSLSRALPGQGRSASLKRPWHEVDMENELDADHSSSAGERREAGAQPEGYARDDRARRRQHTSSSARARGSPERMNTEP